MILSPYGRRLKAFCFQIWQGVPYFSYLAKKSFLVLYYKYGKYLRIVSKTDSRTLKQRKIWVSFAIRPQLFGINKQGWLNW